MSPSMVWTAGVLAIASLVKLVEFPAGWRGILAEMAGQLWPLGPHFAPNMAAGLAGVAGMAALFFICDAAGLRLLRMVAGNRPAGALRLSSFFIGYALLSMALFGLALAGLWFPFLLWLAPVILAVFSAGEFRMAAGEWRGWMGRTWSSCPMPGRIALAASLLWWFPLVAGPEINADCIQYHFGFPSQILLAHKFIGRGIYLAWGYPLLVEMPNVFAVMSHLDGLAHAMRPVMALAGVVAFLSGTGLWTGPASGLGVAGLALLAPSFAYVMGYSKNDAFAAGALLALAGIIAEGGLWRRKPLDAAAVFSAGLISGILLASKHTMLIPVTIFLAGALYLTRHRDRFRFLALVIPAVALFPLAWWAKAWLFFRDPFYPLGAVFLPSLFADPGLGGSEKALYRIFIQGGRPLGMLPHDLLALARNNGIFFLAALPFISSGMPVGTRRVLGFSALALAGMALAVRGSIGDLERFCLPVFTLVNAVSLAAILLNVSGAKPRVAVVSALFLLGTVFQLDVMATQGDFFREAPVTRWLSGRDGGEDFRERALVSYGAILPGIRKSVAGGSGRILAVGETYSWGIPLRIIGEGFESPFAWKSAVESPDSRRVAIRWKQAGIRWILYNHMAASWNRFQNSPFVWTPAALRRYADFAVPRLALLARSGRYDPGVGSDTLYEVRPRALSRSRVLFLPGIEPALSFASLAWLNSAFGESARRFADMGLILPEVAWVDVLEAQSLLDVKNYRKALRLVRAAERAGFEDDISLFTHAVAAGRSGLAGEAEKALARSRLACPLMEKQYMEARREAGLPPGTSTGLGVNDGGKRVK